MAKKRDWLPLLFVLASDVPKTIYRVFLKICPVDEKKPGKPRSNKESLWKTMCQLVSPKQKNTDARKIGGQVFNRPPITIQRRLLVLLFSIVHVVCRAIN